MQKKKTREEIRREDDPRGKPQGEIVTGPRPSAPDHPLAGSDVLDEEGTGFVPKRPMHDVVHGPDDEGYAPRLGPEEAASISFRPDHELADAAAELAEDLARGFLDGATQKVSDWSEEAGDDALHDEEVGGPYHLDAPEEGGPEEVGDVVATEPPEQERREPRPPRGRRGAHA